MPSPEPPGPIPTFATFGPVPPFFDRLTVTFDQALIAGPIAGTNWTYHDPTGGPWITINPGTAAGNQVTVDLVQQVGPADPPSRCDYTAAPADVKALDGTPAPAFADFPVTVIP